jgi:hypothetical protein
MTTTFNQNSAVITVDKFAGFNRTTGEASNIDAVIANCSIGNVIYANGQLALMGENGIAAICPDGSNACYNDDLAIAFPLTDDELDAQYA